MSKRAKFTLITWIGENVGGLQRAKISTDKALVKEIVQVSDSVVLHAETVPVMFVIMRLKELEAVMVCLGKVDGPRGNMATECCVQSDRIGF